MNNIINKIKETLQSFIKYIISLIQFAEEKIGRKALIGIVIGVVLLIGLIIFLTRPKYLYKETGQEEVPTLTTEDARSIVESALTNVLKIYENPKELFEVVEVYKDETEEKKEDTKEEEKEKPEIEDDYTEEEEEKKETVKVPIKYEIKDYSKKINTIFTTKGKSEFEKMTFGGEKYYEKKDGKIYFNTNVVPKENKFLGDSYSISQLVFADGEITCKIHFSRLSINDRDEVSYAVYTKNLTLMKTLDNWVVSSFKYTLEK